MYITTCGQSGTVDMLFPSGISRSGGNVGYICSAVYIQIDPVGTSDIFVPLDISKSSGYNLSAGYIQIQNLYFPAFCLSSCHVRPISSIRQISGFLPDASRLVFFLITTVPRQIFSRQICLALTRRAHNERGPPFLIKVPPCILSPTHSCNDMMACELVMSLPLSVVLPLRIV